MNRLGFRAGYAGLWEQRATYNLLIERVFAFADSQGANLWYTTLRRQALASKDYQGDVGTLDIPNSYGVDLEASTGIHSYRVGFVKGNVMFVVHADAPAGSDLRVMAVQQAEAEYENAPASVTARPAQSSQSATSSMLAAGGAILGGALLIALVVATAAIAISRRSADPLS